MKKVLANVAIAATLAAFAAHEDGGAQLGVLTSKLTGAENDIVYAKEDLDCGFKLNAADAQNFTGQIKSIGVNLSVTKDIAMVWDVLAPSTKAGTPEHLNDRYVGGAASVGLAADGGGDILVARSNDSDEFQQLSGSGKLGAPQY